MTVQALPLISGCMTVGKLLNLLKPQIHFQSRDNNAFGLPLPTGVDNCN